MPGKPYLKISWIFFQWAKAGTCCSDVDPGAGEVRGAHGDELAEPGNIGKKDRV